MTSWIAQHESVTMEPGAAAWRCRSWPITDPGAGAAARRFREQVGLAIDRPVVMSGHQAAFWHAGIAAKVFALDAAGERFGASTAWVAVDQDLGMPGRVAYPVLRTERAGGSSRLARGTADLLTPEGAHVVTGRQRAGPARPIDDEKGAGSGVAAGLRRLCAALDRHTGASSRAMQVTGAALDGLGSRPAVLSALGLARTDLFADMVAAMRRDPGACVAAYNAAVARHPEARMRHLAAASSRGAELPLWRITGGGAREPVFAADLAAEPLEGLAPRALTMTALLRWAGCDLFIHGLGGGHYDPVMEEWLGSWLGVGGLAPAVVVSATRLMPLVENPPPTPEEVARAVWAVHHARHDPESAMGGGAAVGAKRALARGVREAEGPERLARYRAMHEWVERERRAHAADLAALGARAAEVAARSALSGIVFDRTWPTGLLPEGSVDRLREEIRGRIRS